MVGRLSGLRRADAKARAAELLARFDLADAADRILKGYSGGMRRRLDLAAGLVTRLRRRRPARAQPDHLGHRHGGRPQRRPQRRRHRPVPDPADVAPQRARRALAG
jgi:hypothetical protein